MPGVKKLFANALSRRSPKSRSSRDAECRSEGESTGCTHMLLVQSEEVDEEAQLRPPPKCHRLASHAMENDEEFAGVEKNAQSDVSIMAVMTADDDPDEAGAWEKLKKVAAEQTNMRKLIDASWDEIEENWLGEIDQFPGNQYMFSAFGLYRISEMRAGESLFSPRRQKAFSRIFGALSVWMIQLIGPPGIFLSTVFAWGVFPGQEIKWSEWQIDFEDWQHIALTKTLSLFAIFCFILNGIFVMLDEKATWVKIDHIFTYFQNSNPDITISGEVALYIGAITNSWVVLWCCLDTLVILGAAQNPKDVIFDSLGLIFLFNLDDIEGDLGFISDDDWPGERLGWMYRWIQREAYKTQRQTGKRPDDGFDLMSNIIFQVYNGTILSLYAMAIGLPVVAALTSFSKLVPDD